MKKDRKTGARPSKGKREIMAWDDGWRPNWKEYLIPAFKKGWERDYLIHPGPLPLPKSTASGQAGDSDSTTEGTSHSWTTDWLKIPFSNLTKSL